MRRMLKNCFPLSSLFFGRASLIRTAYCDSETWTTTSVATRRITRRALSKPFRSGRQSHRPAQAGCVVPELNNPRVRERFLYSYRLLYEIGNERIGIAPARNRRIV